MVTFGVWVLFFMWLTGRPIFLNRWGRSNRLLLLGEMIRAYKLLEANLGVISTYSVRNALLELQNKGAAWDPAALAVLDTAAARPRSAWLLH